ncbi:hypothetical protein PVL29_007501 [Vitis rotundifolia]|uniref:Telomere repeat-binding protein 5 n=1 Tax=Vitis rotundifolia TaxID=103349 RepID=A0AA38ZZY8_VITRO|nr:hypothetical protein PVL29_007501 [Vitis rotundifolia]
MVLQKRLDYGFNGYQVPATPRATRSARRRGSFRKKVEDNQMFAFDLLATVAGKLLLEGEKSPDSVNTSNGKEQCVIAEDHVKNEGHAEDKPLKIEPCDQGNSGGSFIVSELSSQMPSQKYCLREFPCPQNDACSALASVITSDCSEKVGCAEKLVIGNGKNETESFASKVEVGSSGFREFNDRKLENETKRQIKVEPIKTGRAILNTGAGMFGSEDQVVWDGKPSVLVSSNSSAEVPACRDNIPCGSFPLCRGDVKVVSRDDDDNSSGCTQPSTSTKSFRPLPRIGDRRIRKLLASRYWKVTPKLKEDGFSNVDGEVKPIYRNKRNCYKRQRSQRNYPFKKRKLLYCSSVSNSEGGNGNERISDSPQMGINGDASGSGLKLHGGIGTSASVAGQHTSFQSRDSHVKLRIKSFRVPELFIEIPETATVGSLKRTVMEAVTAILGGGLRVGVLLRGKKVRDDSKTLQQTGISQDDQMDALGFTLEPNPSQAPQALCPGDNPFLLPYDTPQPLIRYPPTPMVAHQGTSDASPDPPVTNLCNFVESDHDSAPSPDTDMSIDKSVTDSKALVSVPAMSVEALAVVPVHRKSKRSEIVQRRIRRPFSVSEVEALVQAVEKLGTGRWRDVKLRAFDNAKHRTYVDLKDKWKTLVHTARISPQQRRGEPVPQELLDRVLTAHAYWSQQQAKQQLKHQSETCLLL